MKQKYNKLISNKQKSNKQNRKSRKYYKTRKNKIYGGSSIYDDGIITKTSLTYRGIPFFRKIFYYSDPPTEQQKHVVLAENKIVKILMKNPYPNIVKYFTVNKKFVDMEELDTCCINIKKVKEIMRNVKDFLQSLGILYIDWKFDNIGRGVDGEYKLFDFDSSGIINLNNNEWIVKPVPFWSYRHAIENGFTEPKQIDDWSFEHNILNLK